MFAPHVEPTAAAPQSAGAWSDIGWAASWMGLVFAATNAFYGVEAQKGQLKAQASSMDHAASMARRNAKQTESEVQYLMDAGKGQKASLTLQQGQERASLIAGQAASGAGPGGSNAEVRASQRLLQRIDAMTLDSNTIRATNAAKARGVNAENEALMAGVSAQNLRGSAGSMSPWAAAGASALGGAGQLSSQWVYRERFRGGR